MKWIIDVAGLYSLSNNEVQLLLCDTHDDVLNMISSSHSHGFRVSFWRVGVILQIFKVMFKKSKYLNNLLRFYSNFCKFHYISYIPDVIEFQTQYLTRTSKKKIPEHLRLYLLRHPPNLSLLKPNINALLYISTVMVYSIFLSYFILPSITLINFFIKRLLCDSWKSF
jgi:hypothetical protein